MSLSGLAAGEEEGKGNDRGHTGGKAIEPVDDVDQIGHRDDPDHRQRDAPGSSIEEAAKRVGHPADAYPRGNDEPGHDELDRQFGERGKRPQVVDHPQQQDGPAAGREDRDQPVVRAERDRRRNEETNVNRNAAEVRERFGVHAA